MRHFYLENSKGRWLDLQSEPLFLTKPTGLGFGMKRDYAQIEYGFFAELASEYEQPTIEAELVIMEGDYSEYGKLVEWCADADSIKLVYKPNESRTLLMDVDLEKIELEEMTMYGSLVVPIVMKGKTPYHSRFPKSYEFSIGMADNPMRFTFQFPFRFSQSTADSVQKVNVRGHMPAAMELSAFGPLSKPVLRAEVVESGEILGLLDISDISLAEGEELYYSSQPNDTGLWKIIGDKKTAIHNVFEPENENFIRIPPGKDVALILSADIDPTYTGLKKPVAYIHEYFMG